MSRNRFTVKLLKIVEIKSGFWKYSRIGVFDNDSQIGEYVLNYPTNVKIAFAAFEQGGNWYALFCKDYQNTSLMVLPSCNILVDEVASGNGFCPVEYFVPTVAVCENQDGEYEEVPAGNPRHDPSKWATRGVDGFNLYPDQKGHPDYPGETFSAAKELYNEAVREWSDRNNYVTKSASFGFVSGCVWGDDASVKVRFLDLSKAAGGEVAMDSRFGYVELPYGISLKDAVDCLDVENIDGSVGFVNIATVSRFKVSTGRLVVDE